MNIMTNEKENVGEAYALFYCEASEEQFKAELPKIRSLVQTPSQLEITLKKGTDLSTLGSEEKNFAISRGAIEDGMNYSLQARCKNMTNKEAAGEVTAILNQAYQSPLYKDGVEFRGGVFYEQNGRYVFAD